MSDLIDRQMLKADLLCGDNVEHDYCFPCKKILERIDNQPSAQPERKKGKWILVEESIKVAAYKCSECGRNVWTDKGYDVMKDYPFCHCGADMRGEQK